MNFVLMELILTGHLRVLRLELISLVTFRIAMYNELERRTILIRLLARDNASEVVRRCLAAVEYVLGLVHRRNDLFELIEFHPDCYRI